MPNAIEVEEYNNHLIRVEADPEPGSSLSAPPGFDNRVEVKLEKKKKNGSSEKREKGERQAETGVPY
ncbi:hypothetical protein PIB30_067451, partial [Stylosanthes scabra]|nr:hypothetical protein [Stylosanthes scabra]